MSLKRKQPYHTETPRILNIHFFKKIIAVAIETAIQNGGIAVVVLNLTFPRY